MQLSDKAIVQVLRKSYPEVIDKITSDISIALPEHRLTDLTKLASIIQVFNREKQINAEDFSNPSYKRKTSQNRKLLMALVLLFYNPERLCNITRKETIGLSKMVSDLTGSHIRSITVSANDAVTLIKIYKDFKIEVYRLYDLINKEFNFFNHGKEN
ncbi:hypothetical protein [Pedobacter sp. Leaf170]|uniref:hypothetical protein n=1 Tax=Pedobacter sp. Leaf170 TaxID=2876558 RepID=UPI001E40FD07|nr:hypothetical protein [Pedobacter sp. Leaf170]